MTTKKVAVVVLDRFKSETKVILCPEDKAKEILEELYMKELVNNALINVDGTYISDTKAVIDYIYGFKEIRITKEILN